MAFGKVGPAGGARKMMKVGLWTKLCTYTTVKKCQIVDAKIAISHKVVMLGVVAYILINLILGFGYMLQETPNAVVNAYVEEADYATTVAALKLAPPSYCDNPATDYSFSASWTYTNNTCDFDLSVGDILTKGENAVFITTYFQDTPSDATAAAAAGLAAGNYFVPGVESMKLSFDHTVTTSWGLSAFNPELNLHAFGGVVQLLNPVDP